MAPASHHVTVPSCNLQQPVKPHQTWALLADMPIDDAGEPHHAPSHHNWSVVSCTLHHIPAPFCALSHPLMVSCTLINDLCELILSCLHFRWLTVTSYPHTKLLCPCLPSCKLIHLVSPCHITQECNLIPQVRHAMLLVHNSWYSWFIMPEFLSWHLRYGFYPFHTIAYTTSCSL